MIFSTNFVRPKLCWADAKFVMKIYCVFWQASFSFFCDTFLSFRRKKERKVSMKIKIYISKTIIFVKKCMCWAGMPNLLSSLSSALLSLPGFYPSRNPLYPTYSLKEKESNIINIINTSFSLLFLSIAIKSKTKVLSIDRISADMFHLKRIYHFFCLMI